MISKETLKKHNLKAVPFSCIGEGQTFNIDIDFWWKDYYATTRKIKNGLVCFSNKHMGTQSLSNDHETVYVPVWRVTNETITV